MDERFSRNIPALSPEECAMLRGKRVLIAGCGGLGGYAAELLVRAGVGAFRVVDADVFEPSNLNRQLLATPALLGSAKAAAAAQRVRSINPDAAVEAFETLIGEHNVSALVMGCDAVVDGLDNIPSRRILARVCSAQNVPYIYGAVSGWVAQAGVSLPGDNLIDRIYPENAALSGKSVLSFAPALCAAVQAALCVRLLIGRAVKTGELLYFDLLHQDFETIAL